ncbi:MAG: FkbM family methyltransferase [Desulfuromonadales bacterium]
MLDVGANTGEFATMLRKSGYKGRIVSFEPRIEAYEELVHNANNDPLWTIAPRMALGDFDGEISMNISENLVSSSIVNVLDAHLDAAPESRYIGSEMVPVFRLDTVTGTYAPSHARTFLKIDTQGLEKQVLAGASRLIPQLKGLQLEISLRPMYEGDGRFVDMVQSLGNMGFEACGFFDVFSDQRTGNMLQVDGIFFRENG